MTARLCAECGATYLGDGDSCAVRFERLLALDHSRREPWGSRHGQAFAAFALQHPLTHSRSLDAAWMALHRIYLEHEAPADVFTSLRRAATRGPESGAAAARPSSPVGAPSVTIADLDDFDAGTYAERLDAWCAASLRMWGAALDAARP